MKTWLGVLVFLFELQVWGAAVPGWEQIKPGGDTRCARGGEFSFYVHRGDSDKVVVSFSGGGACWDQYTCDTDLLYTDNVDRSLNQIRGQAGIFDFNDSKNPYKSWTHIFIPYCTGDVHLGNGEGTYTRDDGTTFTIQHRGAVNSRAALQWVMNNYKSVNQISVNGCSAGSYASIVWTPTLAENYKSAKLMQFGDSGAGVADSLFFPQWNLRDSMPRWIPGLDPSLVDVDALNIVDVYSAVAQSYPQARFSQFHHSRDRVQIFYFAALGGNASEWTPRMFKNMSETEVKAPNFRYFVAPGKNHCAITNARLYNTSSDGANLGRWLGLQVSGKDVENVKCKECTTSVK